MRDEAPGRASGGSEPLAPSKDSLDSELLARVEKSLNRAGISPKLVGEALTKLRRLKKPAKSAVMSRLPEPLANALKDDIASLQGEQTTTLLRESARRAYAEVIENLASNLAQHVNAETFERLRHAILPLLASKRVQTQKLDSLNQLSKFYDKQVIEKLKEMLPLLDERDLDSARARVVVQQQPDFLLQLTSQLSTHQYSVIFRLVSSYHSTMRALDQREEGEAAAAVLRGVEDARVASGVDEIDLSLGDAAAAAPQEHVVDPGHADDQMGSAGDADALDGLDGGADDVAADPLGESMGAEQDMEAAAEANLGAGEQPAAAEKETTADAAASAAKTAAAKTAAAAKKPLSVHEARVTLRSNFLRRATSVLGVASETLLPQLMEQLPHLNESALLEAYKANERSGRAVSSVTKNERDHDAEMETKKIRSLIAEETRNEKSFNLLEDREPAAPAGNVRSSLTPEEAARVEDRFESLPEAERAEAQSLIEQLAQCLEHYRYLMLLERLRALIARRTPPKSYLETPFFDAAERLLGQYAPVLMPLLRRYYFFLPPKLISEARVSFADNGAHSYTAAFVSPVREAAFNDLITSDVPDEVVAESWRLGSNMTPLGVRMLRAHRHLRVLQTFDFEVRPELAEKMVLAAQSESRFKVYVSNLPVHITASRLLAAMENCGRVTGLEIFKERLFEGEAAKGRKERLRRYFRSERESPVHAFVYFADEQSMLRALDPYIQLFGLVLDGQTCFTEAATDRRTLSIANLPDDMHFDEIKFHINEMIYRRLPYGGRLVSLSQAPMLVRSEEALRRKGLLAQFSTHEAAVVSFWLFTNRKLLGRRLRVSWARTPREAFVVADEDILNM